MKKGISKDNLPRVLSRAKGFWVFHKPYGMTVYAEQGSDEALLTWAKQHFERSFFPVHRLDKTTCGLVIMALTPQDSNLLQREFEGRKISKQYLAILDRDCPDRFTVANALDGKSAQTRFEVLERRKNEETGQLRTLLLCEPTTGRKHQIRRHLSLRDLPILGDKTYGGRSAPRVYLSATQLEFKDPQTRRMVQFRTQPDVTFKQGLTGR